MGSRPKSREAVGQVQKKQVIADPAKDEDIAAPAKQAAETNGKKVPAAETNGKQKVTEGDSVDDEEEEHDSEEVEGEEGAEEEEGEEGEEKPVVYDENGEICDDFQECPCGPCIDMTDIVAMKAELDLLILFVRNLPDDATKKEIKGLNKDIRDVRINRANEKKGILVSSAFVEFKTEKKCDRAYRQLRKMELRGKKLDVDYIGVKSKKGNELEEEGEEYDDEAVDSDDSEGSEGSKDDDEDDDEDESDDEDDSEGSFDSETDDQSGDSDEDDDESDEEEDVPKLVENDQEAAEKVTNGEKAEKTAPEAAETNQKRKIAEVKSVDDEEKKVKKNGSK